jgi:competence protein ComEA
MLKTLTYRLLLIASLLMLSTSMQALATEKPEETMKSALASGKQVHEKTSINQANNKELSAINGIGISKAQAIIDYREKHGDFASIEELVKVKGIGHSTLQKIKSFISL